MFNLYHPSRVSFCLFHYYYLEVFKASWHGSFQNHGMFSKGANARRDMLQGHGAGHVATTKSRTVRARGHSVAGKSLIFAK